MVGLLVAAALLLLLVPIVWAIAAHGQRRWEKEYEEAREDASRRAVEMPDRGL